MKVKMPDALVKNFKITFKRIHRKKNIWGSNWLDNRGIRDKSQTGVPKQRLDQYGMAQYFASKDRKTQNHKQHSTTYTNNRTLKTTAGSVIFLSSFFCYGSTAPGQRGSWLHFQTHCYGTTLATPHTWKEGCGLGGLTVDSEGPITKYHQLRPESKKTQFWDRTNHL